MKALIKVEPDLDEAFAEIHTKEITPEINEIIKFIGGSRNKVITGTKNEKIYILNPNEIICFYCLKQKVFAKTEKDDYNIKQRLYEIENELCGTSFVRISNSAIANIDKIMNLEMDINGTMSVKFKDGSIEYISRRFVSKIKNYLGL